MRAWDSESALGQMVRYAEIDKVRGGEDRCLERGADADDGTFHFLDTELAQGFEVGGVGHDGVGKQWRMIAHESLINVDAEDLYAVAGQFVGKRATEAAEADDHNRWDVDALFAPQQGAGEASQ